MASFAESEQAPQPATSLKKPAVVQDEADDEERGLLVDQAQQVDFEFSQHSMDDTRANINLPARIEQIPLVSTYQVV